MAVEFIQFHAQPSYVYTIVTVPSDCDIPIHFWNTHDKNLLHLFSKNNQDLFVLSCDNIPVPQAVALFKCDTHRKFFCRFYEMKNDFLTIICNNNNKNIK